MAKRKAETNHRKRLGTVEAGSGRMLHVPLGLNKQNGLLKRTISGVRKGPRHDPTQAVLIATLDLVGV